MKKIVFIGGGLGNQMFNYSYAMMLREKGYDVICDWGLLKRGNEHNGYELTRVFTNIDSECTLLRPFFFRISYTFVHVLRKPALTRIFELFNWKYITDAQEMRNPPNNLNLFLGGSTMSIDLLPKFFKFKFHEENLSYQSICLSNEMKKKNSVSVHIRRGDYLSSTYKWLYQNICTEKYYNNAINYILTRVESPVFYFFSNDVDWVREKFSGLNYIIVEHNFGINSWQDMYLMSTCKHNIVANSTFSWWGAYLNPNLDKIVIRPSRFDNDNRAPHIFPNEWIVING